MPLLAPAPRADAPTSASILATDNWRANLASLDATQSPVVDLLASIELDLEWTFGRDGTLTGKTSEGRWWAGCSVPTLAGRALLATLDADPLSSCLLSPAHAGLVLASRERTGSALIVLQPDAEIARVILACHDFSADILSHRLWFNCGPKWAVQLRQLFDDYPGLAIPARFIRTKLTPPETADELIAEAQAVFSTALQRRAEMVSRLQSGGGSVCKTHDMLLVGGSEFRLWEPAAEVLERELTGQSVKRFDTDDPLSTSPIALIEAVQTCRSIVSANICRADSTNVVPMELPWITWMTQPAAPPFDSAGPRDEIILADDSWRGIARAAGWPEHRVHICGWPGSIKPSTSPPGPALGLICDTVQIEVPESIDEFSSHRVLWEMIEAELHDDPLTVDDPDLYLRNRASQLNIDMESLDVRRFIHELILPAYQQGLARLLIAGGLPIRIWGRGWDEIIEFKALSSGPILSAASFESALAGSSALVHCWPIVSAHPIRTTGKPVLHRTGREKAMLIRDANRLLLTPGVPPLHTITGDSLNVTIRELLSRP